MILKKIGLVYKPNSNYDWMTTHCQLPSPVLLNDNGLCRIFFAGRSQDQISSVGFCDINLNNPSKVLKFGKTPVLKPGEIGHFDQFGVFPSSVIKKDGKFWMYYIGWIKGATPPLFYASIGLAISEDCESFEKFQTVPVMSTSIYDPCLVTSPFVFEDKSMFQMAYVSGEKWTEKGNKLQSHYNIKHATSKDGVNWNREGVTLVGFSSDSETNIARPSILKINNKYHMWFSYVKASAGYRIGYSHSTDGIRWCRKDEDVVFSTDGKIESADNETQCYPSVLSFNGRLFMFYNGNNFGKFGIELAEIMDLDV